MKSWAKKILFKNKQPKTFPAVRIKNGEIREKIFLKRGHSEADITEKNCIVCHSPFMMAVWMTSEQSSVFDQGTMQATVIVANKLCAKADLSFSQKIEESGTCIILYTITNATCYQLDSIRKFFLLRYFKNKDTILQGKIYSALYSYPRRVIAVSYREEDDYNIFPMDFQGFISESNLYILGLRTTNITLEKIIRTRKVVVADTDKAPLETLYFLGNHHKRAPSSINNLPFKVTESERYKFPIPDFAAGYKEIEIITNQKLGTHMFMVGKIVNEKERWIGNSSIYHIHFFQSFNSDYDAA